MMKAAETDRTRTIPMQSRSALIRFRPVIDRFLPSGESSVISCISALFTYPVKYRFPGIPGKTVVFKQLRLHIPELVAVQMDQFPAGFADTMKMRGTLPVFHVSITRAFTRTEDVFPNNPVFNESLQLTINRCCTNGLVLRDKMVHDLCGRKMFSRRILQEIQKFCPGPCAVS
jgi:hypothetical protein